MYLSHWPRHVQPSTSKIFIPFPVPVFKFKNSLYIVYFSLSLPSFAAILFVFGWLVLVGWLVDNQLVAGHT